MTHICASKMGYLVIIGWKKSREIPSAILKNIVWWTKTFTKLSLTRQLGKKYVILCNQCCPCWWLGTVWWQHICRRNDDHRYRISLTRTWVAPFILLSFKQMETLWSVILVLVSNQPLIGIRNTDSTVNTLRPRQNGRHFPDDVFNCIFLNENVWFSIEISLKFVPKGPINNIPALV